MDRSIRLTQTLTLLGAVPFLALAIGHAGAFDARFGLPEGMLAQAFLAYGAVIASFMAGTIWMQAELQGVRRAALLLLSNVAALLVFATLALPMPGDLALVLQGVTFIALLACDGVTYRAGRQAPWYFRLRCLVTLIVCCAYLLLLLAG